MLARSVKTDGVNRLTMCHARRPKGIRRLADGRYPAESGRGGYAAHPRSSQQRTGTRETSDWACNATVSWHEQEQATSSAAQSEWPTPATPTPRAPMNNRMAIHAQNRNKPRVNTNMVEHIYPIGMCGSRGEFAIESKRAHLRFGARRNRFPCMETKKRDQGFFQRKLNKASVRRYD